MELDDRYLWGWRFDSWVTFQKMLSKCDLLSKNHLPNKYFKSDKYILVKSVSLLFSVRLWDSFYERLSAVSPDSNYVGEQVISYDKTHTAWLHEHSFWSPHLQLQHKHCSVTLKQEHATPSATFTGHLQGDSG